MRRLERSRSAAQIENVKRLKDTHLPRAKRYQDYREMLDKQFIRAIAIPGVYDPTNPHPRLSSSPRGDVVPKIEEFLNAIATLRNQTA